jgi:DNA-directed RNA polymerase specialized sigma24 family protein
MAALPVLPPSSPRPWTDEERHALTECLYTLSHQHHASEVHIADLIRELIPRLIAPSGVRRYKEWRRHQEKAHTPSDYYTWLERIVEGYLRYRPMLQNGTETAEGTVPVVKAMIEGMVNRYCRQINFVLDGESRRDLVNDILLSLFEGYFYDTELEAWLQKTTRNHVHLAVRSRRRGRELALGENIPDSERERLEWVTTFADILAGIRRVRNRRYRVILLLILLYRFDNIQLATFFGVSIDVIYTWCSQARRALRQCMSESSRMRGL